MYYNIFYNFNIIIYNIIYNIIYIYIFHNFNITKLYYNYTTGIASSSRKSL